MKFYALLKKYAAVRTSFVIALIGIFFCIGGIIGIISQNKQNDWVETSATIQSIDTSTEGEDSVYTVIVVYTDENGVSHTTKLGSYFSGMQVGQNVTIKYDKNNPENIADTSSAWFVYLLLGVGTAAFVGGSLSTVLAIKKSSKDYDDFDKVDPTSFTPEQVYEVSNSAEGSNEYIYHIAGKLGYNYLMETPNQEKVFEARCDKIGIVTANQYTFINHLTHEEEKAEISHTVTTESEAGNIGIELFYHFNINGENCWDHLGKLGYSIDPHLEGLSKVNFSVKKYGVQVATIATAGVNSIPGAKQYPWGNISSNVVLKVNCRPSDIDGVAFACFCILRK